MFWFIKLNPVPLIKVYFLYYLIFKSLLPLSLQIIHRTLRARRGLPLLSNRVRKIYDVAVAADEASTAHCCQNLKGEWFLQSREPERICNRPSKPDALPYSPLLRET